MISVIIFFKHHLANSPSDSFEVTKKVVFQKDFTSMFLEFTLLMPLIHFNILDKHPFMNLEEFIIIKH